MSLGWMINRLVMATHSHRAVWSGASEEFNEFFLSLRTVNSLENVKSRDDWRSAGWFLMRNESLSIKMFIVFHKCLIIGLWRWRHQKIAWLFRESFSRKRVRCAAECSSMTQCGVGKTLAHADHKSRREIPATYAQKFLAFSTSSVLNDYLCVKQHTEYIYTRHKMLINMKPVAPSEADVRRFSFKMCLVWDLFWCGNYLALHYGYADSST